MYFNPIMEELRKSGRLNEESKNITVGKCHDIPVLVYTDPVSGHFGHMHNYETGGIDCIKDQLDVELFQRVYSLVS